MKELYVVSDIQSVIDPVMDDTEPVTVHIPEGVFYGRVEITRPDVTLVGEGAGRTVITYDRYALETMEDGGRRGTFRSYTMLADGDRITLRSLSIRNTAGEGSRVGQAIALYAEGNGLTVEDCEISGHQDTLFTGPLPPREIIPGGFIGPKQFSPRINGVQHYRRCEISGDVDFIFGSATAYFEECEIRSCARRASDEGSVHGYVTAASTPEGQAVGYVFRRCRFTGDAPKGTVYIGRPWRDYARVELIECVLGDHIHPDLFHDWDKPLARENACYIVDGNRIWR